MSLLARTRRILLTDKWNVGVAMAPVSGLLDGSLAFSEVKWLPEIRGGFIADPFAVSGIDENGDLLMLAEVYDYRTQLGRICALRFNVKSGRLDIVETPSLSAGVHMSYPFLFQHAGEIFCVPETHEARCVYLYRALNYPEEWVREAVLLEDFPAADATVFQYGDRWWMFATNVEQGSNTFLYAWHSEELLGPWRPHKSNPIKTDITSSRPAGRPFVVDGKLYRPAQDGSKTYGGRVVIHQIIELTPERFQEEVVAEIGPLGRYPEGLHTVVPVGDITLIDGKRCAFNCHMLLRNVRLRLRHLRRSLL